MKKILLSCISILFFYSYVCATPIIVTDPSNDRLLTEILNFDAGSLGIVDIDFGGVTFNQAFSDLGRDAYLFPTSKIEVQDIMNDISTLLESPTYSSINSVQNAIPATGRDTSSYINLAWGFGDSSSGSMDIFHVAAYYLTTDTISIPPDNHWSSANSSYYNYMRMTPATPDAASPVPEPSTMILFGLGLLCLTGTGRKLSKIGVGGFSRRKTA